jgi:hypothetical protein
LPASWGTLATLAELPPGEIPKRIEDALKDVLLDVANNP